MVPMRARKRKGAFHEPGGRARQSPARRLRIAKLRRARSDAPYLFNVPRTENKVVGALRQRGDSVRRMTNMNPNRANAILDLIGNTPLVPLHFEPEGVTLYAKCEFLNPSGSIKDRLAKSVIVDAEQRGLLGPDSIILECTSGNTGIALAMVGAAKGYRVTVLMSEGASHERRQLIQQLGADLILFKSSGYQTGIDLSREMAAKDRRYF